MPGQRSRQGCEECRKRRRKCDEVKPSCGQCTTYNRSCNYSIRLIWGGRKFKRSCFGKCLRTNGGNAAETSSSNGGFVYGTESVPESLPDQPEKNQALIPRQLPNGIALQPRYRRLLSYFAEDILASLSTHTSIHHDLRQGLMPVMLESPHLMSASLAMSAAGLLSRGVTDIDGIETGRMIEHLQTSGISLLRTALEKKGEESSHGVLLMTCLFWCLADVFAARQSVSSWQVHLQGVQAIVNETRSTQRLFNNSGPSISALRHLYQLYLSLEILPHLASFRLPEQPMYAKRTELGLTAGAEPRIDGFLGYDEEILEVLQDINRIGTLGSDDILKTYEADLLQGKLQGMIRRDYTQPPTVSISSLQPEATKDFFMCHRSFQQATLIRLYWLYKTPSSSECIRSAVSSISEMIESMTQGKPCHTWVAMSMPLFTIGCEAFNDEQKEFVRDKVQKLEICLGSLHVRVVQQALEDMWKLRTARNDHTGHLCAGELLDELKYSVILF